MGSASVSPWVTIFVAVISAGGLKYLYDSFKDWRSAPTPEVRKQSSIDASIVTVSLARDELAEDNQRLREILAEERANGNTERQRFERERLSWDAERISLRHEIDLLRAQIEKERQESAERYDLLLKRLAELSARHASPPSEA